MVYTMVCTNIYIIQYTMIYTNDIYSGKIMMLPLHNTWYRAAYCVRYIPYLSGNGQHHDFARVIEISRFFRDLILVDPSEMNYNVGFIFLSALSGFVQACAFSTFKFDAICFNDFLTRILINGFFEFWTSVPSLLFENSRLKFMLKLMQLLYLFEF